MRQQAHTLGKRELTAKGARGFPGTLVPSVPLKMVTAAGAQLDLEMSTSLTPHLSLCLLSRHFYNFTDALSVPLYGLRVAAALQLSMAKESQVGCCQTTGYNCL